MITRRQLLAMAAAAGGVVAAGCSAPATPPAVHRPPVMPLALVYRGPAAYDSCSQAAVGLLKGSRWGFDVHYVGPWAAIALSAESLAPAALYVQPGGGSLESAYAQMRGEASVIRQYVHHGGRYAGFCLGGYLAGTSPGFGLFPGEVRRFIESPGANITTDEDSIVRVIWRGRPRHLYFQDGPCFSGASPAQAETLATYLNGTVAALTVPYGNGRVGLVGPHPEAPQEWYTEQHINNPDGVRRELGLDLIDSTMT